MSSSAASPPGQAGPDSGRGWSVPGYTELRPLGDGGFGAVVLARHDATGTPVAIKYLHPRLLSVPDYVEMFRAEAIALGDLDSGYVVRLYEYVEGPLGAAIVMELVDGVALSKILQRHGATTPEAALVVLYGSLLGLAAAHQRGVVHRDYKPANVLVNGNGVSKLTDFGIAARSGDRPVPQGTLRYMPPEQWDGGPASPAGDVYAATVTFYECLAGQPPFSGQTEGELYDKHKSAPIPMEPVPEPLRPIVAVGLAKDPQYRPADAGELAAQLRDAAAGVYGADWEERGRSHLGEAALLLAALWPTAVLPALQGSTVEQVHLAEAASHAQAMPAQAQPSHMSAAAHHRWHVLHMKHLAHLRWLHKERGAAEGRQAAKSRTAAEHPEAAEVRAVREDRASQDARDSRGSRRARDTRRALAVLAGLAVIAAVVTVAVTARATPPPGAPGAASVIGETLTAAPTPAGQATSGPATTIATTVATGNPPISGYSYIVYGLASQKKATLSGTIKKATAGEIVRLYASQFPFSGPPGTAGSVTLTPAGGKASYSFAVSPTLATRYQVKLFANGSASTPLGSSLPSTIYVLPNYQVGGSGCDVGATCTINATYTYYTPPSVLALEMAKPLYSYFAITRGPSGTSPAAPKSLTLNAGNPVIGAPHRASANTFTVAVSVTFAENAGAATPVFIVCQRDTEAQDGFGLPGSRGCGGQTLKNYDGYIR